MSDRDLAKYFEIQADACQRDGSPLYAALLRRAAQDLLTGGVVAELLAGWEGNPLLSALTMRLLGGVHRLVLQGELPELAAYYPTTGGQPVYPDVCEAFIEAVAKQAARIRPFLDEQVQTNEVRRSAVLLPGFLRIASRTGLPFRLLELGASAGLNHIWDRYRYRLGADRWGEGNSGPLLTTEWKGSAPELDAKIEVAERAACDLSPVDVRDPESLQLLDSFIWPDQPERRARFHAAAREVARADISIDRESALPWLRKRLAEQRSGRVTVVFHSIFWLYLSSENQKAVVQLLREVGAAASNDAPLAWLRMEGRDFDTCELRLTTWGLDHPGSGVSSSTEGFGELLGTCGYHGQRVDWEVV